MIYLHVGENEIPRICGKNCRKITLTEQITKKVYECELVLNGTGAWYVATLTDDLPVAQYDVQVLGDDNAVVCTMLAQFGEFSSEKREYTNTHDIKTYNG